MNAPVDEETDLGLRRSCTKRRCIEPARLGGSRRGALCTTHHAAAMQAWRARRRAAGKPVAGASPTALSSSAEAVRDRMRLSRQRKRGGAELQPCAACRGRVVGKLVATHPDVADPQRVVWAHRGCRSLLLRGLAERERDRLHEIERQREQERFVQLCLEIEDLVQALPAPLVTALRATASQGGPLGVLRAGGVLYTQRLARAYAAWCRQHDLSTRESATRE